MYGSIYASGHTIIAAVGQVKNRRAGEVPRKNLQTTDLMELLCGQKIYQQTITQELLFWLNR